MAGLTTLLLDDVGKLLDLALRSEECAELGSVKFQDGDGLTIESPNPRRSEKRKLTLFLVSFLAFLSFEFLSNSMTRFSYGENPATSRMTDLTKVFFSLRVSRRQEESVDTHDLTPFLWDGLTALGMTVVGWPRLRPDRESDISDVMENRHSLPLVSPSSGPPCFDMRRRAPCILSSISSLAALYVPRSHATPTLTGSSSNHFDD